MGKEELTYEALMRILDEMLTKVELLHAPSHDFGTGIPLFRKEIHILQAVGRFPKINITSLAKYMRVTKGAVSQTVSRLVGKGMIRKQYAEASRKEVVLELTDLGWVGFKNHEKFHAEMFELARQHYGKGIHTSLEKFKTVMSDFNAILEEYVKRKETI
jgi:DNA-binding MarR family transcriptional regulator